MRRITQMSLIVTLLAATGCASVTHQRYALTPEAQTCQATETRPSAFSTIVAVVCWGADGTPIGMAGGGGTSGAAVAISLIGSAAMVAGPVAGAAILGSNLVQAAKSINGSTINAVTTGNVTTSGTVSVGSVPNVNVNPVTGTFNLVGP